jgi:hypothetical protein
MRAQFPFLFSGQLAAPINTPWCRCTAATHAGCCPQLLLPPITDGANTPAAVQSMAAALPNMLYHTPDIDS